MTWSLAIPLTAIGHYKAAVQLNPHSADYWFDLASAYQVLGDSANQTVALEHAIQADPMTPDVAWEAANLYLVQGENEKALREFRVVMANDPSLAASAIAFCWRINPDVDLLLRDVVPPTADADLAFLTLLQNDVSVLLSKVISPTPDTDVASLTQQIKKETAGTFKVWNALIESHQPFEEHYAYDYIRFLLQHKEIDQAVLVWQQTAGRFGHSSYLPSAGNLVVNGTFSLEVLNSGFDWQYREAVWCRLEARSDASLTPARAPCASPLTDLESVKLAFTSSFRCSPVRPTTSPPITRTRKTKS